MTRGKFVIFSALAMFTCSGGTGVLYNADDLKDARKIIRTNQTFYLKGASGENKVEAEAFLKRLLCISSSLVFSEERNPWVTRSVDIINNEERISKRSTDGSTCSDGKVSFNVKLQVKDKRGVKLIVKLDGISGDKLQKLGLPELRRDRYEFYVEFADDICLLISYPQKSGNPAIYCTLWIKEGYQKDPPKCCTVIYYEKCKYHNYYEGAYDKMVCAAKDSTEESD